MSDKWLTDPSLKLFKEQLDNHQLSILIEDSHIGIGVERIVT